MALRVVLWGYLGGSGREWNLAGHLENDQQKDSTVEETTLLLSMKVD